jgi:hypothetical protein
MNRLVTLGVCGLLGVLAFSACSDDEDPGPAAGAGGTAGSSGAAGTAGAAGTGGATGGTGGTAGGSGGAGGTGPSALACPGCVRLNLPFTAENQSANYQFNLGAPADFSNAVVTVRLRVNTFGGNAGGVQLYVQNFGGTFPSYGFQFYQNLSAFVGTDFLTVTLDLSQVAAPVDADAGVDAGGGVVVADAGGDAGGGLIVPEGGFDKRAVQIIGFQVTSGGTFAGATFGAAEVDIDSIIVTPTGVTPDRTFATEADSTAFTAAGTPIGTKTYVAP